METRKRKGGKKRGKEREKTGGSFSFSSTFHAGIIPTGFAGMAYYWQVRGILPKLVLLLLLLPQKLGRSTKHSEKEYGSVFQRRYVGIQSSLDIIKLYRIRDLANPLC